MTTEQTIDRIEALKAELAAMRPLPPSAQAVLRERSDLLLTYTSNAIEGNELSLRETAEVIAHGTVIEGKPAKHHLEAQDHHVALDWMHSVAGSGEPIRVPTILQLHALAMRRSAPDIAGRWAVLPRSIQGTDIRFPAPFEVEALTRDLTDGLPTAAATTRQAFDAHYRLVSIHPFDDGNGRTARLLMNLMLVRSGYQPVPVGPEDRIEYLDALERAQGGAGTDVYQALMHRLLLATMTELADTLRDAAHRPPDRDPAPEVGTCIADGDGRSDYGLAEPGSLAEIGRRARRLRELLGLTIEQAAADASVSKAEVMALEAGDAVDLGAVLALHGVLSADAVGETLFDRPRLRSIEDVEAFERRRLGR